MAFQVAGQSVTQLSPGLCYGPVLAQPTVTCSGMAEPGHPPACALALTMTVYSVWARMALFRSSSFSESCTQTRHEARGCGELLSGEQAEGAAPSRPLRRAGLTGAAALWSVTAFTNLSASGVADRMLSTRPSRKRRMDALS